MPVGYYETSKGVVSSTPAQPKAIKPATVKPVVPTSPTK